MLAVFSVRDLQTFTPVELVMMTASVDEDWSLESGSIRPSVRGYLSLEC